MQGLEGWSKILNAFWIEQVEGRFCIENEVFMRFDVGCGLHHYM